MIGGSVDVRKGTTTEEDVTCQVIHEWQADKAARQLEQLSLAES